MREMFSGYKVQKRVLSYCIEKSAIISPFLEKNLNGVKRID